MVVAQPSNVGVQFPQFYELLGFYEPGNQGSTNPSRLVNMGITTEPWLTTAGLEREHVTRLFKF